MGACHMRLTVFCWRTLTFNFQLETNPNHLDRASCVRWNYRKIASKGAVKKWTRATQRIKTF